MGLKAILNLRQICFQRVNLRLRFWFLSSFLKNFSPWCYVKGEINKSKNSNNRRTKSNDMVKMFNVYLAVELLNDFLSTLNHILPRQFSLYKMWKDNSNFIFYRIIPPQKWYGMLLALEMMDQFNMFTIRTIFSPSKSCSDLLLFSL